MPENTPQEPRNNPIDTSVLKYDEPTSQANVDRLEARIEELWGAFPIVNTSPTWIPRTLRDQIAFDRARGRIYYYDFTNQQWRSTITELSDDVSPVLSAALDANGYAITGLDDPTNAQDAATKNYVDSIPIPDPGGTFARITTNGSFNSDSISTTETDVLSTTLAGGTMGANGLLKFRMQISWTLASSAAPACTFRFKIGSSNVAQFDIGQGDTTNRTYNGVIEAICQNLNSESSQQSAGRAILAVDGGGSGTAPAMLVHHAKPTSSVNTASNQTISASVQFSGTGRGTVTVYTCEFELVKVL